MLWVLVVIIAGSLVVAELICRRLGLHTPVLYETTAYGYRVVPDQNLRRFGNRVYYNALGLRSEPCSNLPPAGSKRILCVGDSVTYGGTQTDQVATYPYQLASILERRGKSVEVLNASAGGWAPGNALGWMEANGIHASSVVILQLGTHDLVQRPAGSEIVGRHPQFSDRRPLLALPVLVSRLISRWQPEAWSGDSNIEHTRADVERVGRAIGRMVELTRAAGAEPLILLVEQSEALEPSDELTQFSKSELVRLATARQVRVIRSAPVLDQRGGASNYRDPIHPNEAGNRILAELLADELEKI